jgi:hypothetical protein
MNWIRRYADESEDASQSRTGGNRGDWAGIGVGQQHE